MPSTPPSSLRRELTLVLVATALTALVLAGLTVVLFGALSGGPGDEVAGAASAIRAAGAELRSDGVFDEAAASRVLDARGEVAERVERLPTLASELASRDLPPWSAALIDVLAVRQAAPEAPLGDDARTRAFAEAEARALAGLAQAAQASRPGWVAAVLPWVPWGAAWIVGLAGLAVWRAWRLERQFSGPLAALTAAAARVGEGELSAEMPQIRAGAEIVSLRNSLEAARARLVGSIANLDASRAELATTLAYLTDGVLLLDAQGRLASYNDRVRALWAAAGAVGSPPVPGAPLAEVFPALMGGAGAAFEITLGDDDSALVLGVQRRAVPGGAEVWVLHDVTREREIELMERTFLSMVTHELKTPLTSIGGYASLLLSGKGGALAPRGEGFVQIIHGEAQKLQRMIQDLLDITRLEAGQFPVHPEAVSVGGLVEAVAEAHAGASEQAGVALVADAGDAGALTVWADPARLAQVFGNLVGNALKFTERGGRVALTARAAGPSVVFSVVDTGRGIPSTALPHLFEKFYQVERTDTRLAGGAGLGLFICRQLIEAHGGRIEVHSQVGRGTRFDITLAREGGAHGAQEAG